jgi:chemotaxis methyl-accepting protein methylase
LVPGEWAGETRGGWLVLGAAENLYGISDRFEPLSVGTTLVYRKGAK